MVWKIGEKGKEKTKSRPLAALRNGPKAKVKSIIYYAPNRHILTGYDNGMIGFWNAADAQLYAVIQAHDNSVVHLSISEDSKFAYSST